MSTSPSFSITRAIITLQTEHTIGNNRRAIGAHRRSCHVLPVAHSLRGRGRLRQRYAETTQILPEAQKERQDPGNDRGRLPRLLDSLLRALLDQ
jgi:hypothetical protein